MNLYGVFVAKLRQKACRPFPSELKVWAPAANSFFYPDLTVACDAPKCVYRMLWIILHSFSRCSPHPPSALIAHESLGCAIGVTVPLTAIYKRIAFEPDPKQ